MDSEASVAAAPMVANGGIFEYGGRHFATDFQEVGPSVTRRPLQDFTVDSLSVEFAKCRSRLKTSYANLERTVNLSIGELYTYVSSEHRIEKIKEEIERGDYTQLTKFNTQLVKAHVAPAERSFQETEEEVKEVHFFALELVTECRMKAQETKPKHADRIVGAVASGIVVGLLVCLVGATVLLGLTAGLGIGAVLYISSGSATWERVEELEELSQSFEEVMSSASVMLDFNRAIKRNLECVSRKVDIVNSATEAHQTSSYLVSAFDRLRQKFCSLDPSIYQEQLRTMNKNQ